ncbi:MAG: homoserine dehydrogenase [Oscillospiraceae bacterium]|jgi:homoserine dehydrogenase
MDIGLLGCGNVGRGVLEICDKRADLGLNIRKILVRHERSGDSRFTVDPSQVLDDPGIDCIVEAMGGIEPARSYILRAAASGKHIVTANKKMLAESLPEVISECSDSGSVLKMEACVGGGIPWMANLRRISRLDRIDSFEAVLNGTVNFILSGMEDGRSYEDALREAKKLGYAEQDPTDDVDGYDTRYKAVLTCAEAFGIYVRPEEVPLFGIRNINSDDIANARELGMTVRLTALGRRTASGAQLSVMPCFTGMGSVFSSVRSNYNAASVESNYLGRCVFIGQGSGTYPTADAVVQDLIALSGGEQCSLPEIKEASAVSPEEPWRFYLRIPGGVPGGTGAERTMRGGAVVTGRMPLQELMNAVRDKMQKGMFIARIGEEI